MVLAVVLNSDVYRGGCGGCVSVPIIPLEKLIIFPRVILRFSINEGGDVTTVGRTVGSNDRVFLIYRGSTSISSPSVSSVCSVNIIYSIGRVIGVPGSSGLHIIIGNEAETSVTTFIRDEPCLINSIYIVSRRCRSRSVRRATCYETLGERFRECSSCVPGVSGSIIIGILSVGRGNGLYSCVYAGYLFRCSRGRSVLRALPMGSELVGLFCLLSGRGSALRVRTRVRSGIRSDVSEGRHRCCLHRRVGTVTSTLNSTSGPTRRTSVCGTGVTGLTYSSSIHRGLLKRYGGLVGVPSKSRRNAMIEACLSGYLRVPFKGCAGSGVGLLTTRGLLSGRRCKLGAIGRHVIRSLTMCGQGPRFSNRVLYLTNPPKINGASVIGDLTGDVRQGCAQVTLKNVRSRTRVHNRHHACVNTVTNEVIRDVVGDNIVGPIVLLSRVSGINGSCGNSPSSTLLRTLSPRRGFDFASRCVSFPVSLDGILFVAATGSISRVPTPLESHVRVVRLGSCATSRGFHVTGSCLIGGRVGGRGLATHRFGVDSSTVCYLVSYCATRTNIHKLRGGVTSLYEGTSIRVRGNTGSFGMAPGGVRRVLNPGHFLRSRVTSGGRINIVGNLT